MSKLFTGNGLLTEDGRNAFQTVQSAIDGVLSSVCKNMSESELLTVQAAMAKMVGDTLSTTLQAKRTMVNKLAQMTDAQFEALLTAKYGDNWMFQSLTLDELSRCPKLQQDKIEDILKESAKHITKFPRNGIRSR